MSSKSNKVLPTSSNDLNESVKATERRRKNSTGSFSSPTTENSGRPSLGKKQSSFNGTSSSGKERDNSSKGGGPSPAPLSRARSFAEGESGNRSRSNSISLRDPRLGLLRRNSSFKSKKKKVTFRNPLTDCEPGYFGDNESTPTTGEVDLSGAPLLDDDLKRRQDVRRRRRQERYEQSPYRVGKVTCAGMCCDGCSMMLTSCSIS